MSIRENHHIDSENRCGDFEKRYNGFSVFQSVLKSAPNIRTILFISADLLFNSRMRKLNSATRKLRNKYFFVAEKYFFVDFGTKLMNTAADCTNDAIDCSDDSADCTNKIGHFHLFLQRRAEKDGSPLQNTACFAKPLAYK